MIKIWDFGFREVSLRMKCLGFRAQTYTMKAWSLHVEGLKL